MMVTMAKEFEQTSKVLPEGWKWIRLGDHVTKIGSGITPRGGHTTYLNSGIPLIRSQNVHMNRFEMLGLAYISSEQDNLMKLSRVIKDDVLLNITGASIGRVCVVPYDLCPANVNQHVSIIRSDGSFEPNFLSFYISTPDFQKYILDTEAGATRQALTKSLIENFIIPLPPLEEQKRIVAILNEKMAAIEKARAATLAQIEAAKALPAAYLRQVFDSPEAQTWERKTISELCHNVSDGTHFTPTYLPKGVPFLSVTNVRETGLIFDGCRYISEEEHQFLCKRCKPEKGDVLYTKVGTTGIAKAIDIDKEFSIFVSVALLKIKPKILPEYMEKVLNAPICRVQAANLTQGAANRNLVIQDLKKIIMPVPSLERQKQIVIFLQDRMTKVTKLQKFLQEQLEAINAFPAAILKQAFNGEL